jgi:transcriptional regulator of acetoin/glycerol metabolism
MKRDARPDGDFEEGQQTGLMDESGEHSPEEAERESSIPTTRTVLADGKEHALVRRFRLLVVAGPDAGTTAASDGERMVIGKHDSCDVVLKDTTVSRFHCEVTLTDGRPVVRDLDSRNGTLLDGASIAQGYPRNGSVLTLGGTQVRFDLGTDHVMVPLSQKERFGRLVGHSPAIRAVFALLERAAASDATVLLEGETGTGKEAAAESIHSESAREGGPFIVIDCGAVPPDLLESELFGHERGAFTGAVAAREGAFEAANGGTIFLDEIGELGADLQPKLLRVLERREIKRVGTNKYVPVDVRVVAATNRNLRAEVNAHRFRSDLFYRLAVVKIRLPPLRERLEDLELIAKHILDGLGAPEAEAAALRTPDFLSHLARHAWPGNVRELRNYLERCLALREQGPIIEDGAEPEAPAVNAQMPLKLARETWTRTFERRYIEELLRAHQNNVSAAARAAGVDRPYFYRLLWRHGFR